MRAIPLLLALMLPAAACVAQDGGVPAGARADSLSDFLPAAATASDSADADTLFSMHKSPMGAVLRSALVPGWGQLYNESYWKIPVVLGLSAFLTWGVLTEHTKYADYRDRYAASITALNPGGDLQLKQYREFYRDNRDTYAWWLLVAYLVQIADAYVDAHLYDFTVSDVAQASLLVSPPGALTLRLRW
jgi:hypothetical protein